MSQESSMAEEIEDLREENTRLRASIRNQVGDNLCWLKDPELGKALPREEFLNSCERYYAQISGNGVAFGCLTIAQLEARIIELEDEVARLKALEEGGKTEEDGMTQLKPCPFCSSLEVETATIKSWWVVCNNCGAKGPTKPTENRAALAWNKRV